MVSGLTDMPRKANSFLICIHDICPSNREAVLTIMDRLEPLVGRTVAAAVIPCPSDSPWGTPDGDFVAAIKSRTAEILVHGFSHHRPGGRGPLSWVIGRADEFADLPRAQAEVRLRDGRKRISELFEISPQGFLPPAWCRGPVDRELLGQCGFRYGVVLTEIQAVEGQSTRVPLATWSWDTGRFRILGYAGEGIGRLLSWRPGAIPCIALHPKDLAWGFLDRGLAAIESLLRREKTPVVFRQVLPSTAP